MYTECEVNRYINHVVEGYNATIFTYGQTGSGKTFTMEGYKYKVNENNNSLLYPDDIPVPVPTNSDNIGIIPRCIKELFLNIGEKEAKKFRVY